ncbi:lipopolysaccharide biosynthesis protein [Sphingomonas sp. ac-8]|uniref:lipopolysaccharide biosynthesis protein n=1 Tax=Sphingomonas sp. ac-8 TaxID=3242977 RepID=UPI003A807C91
MKLGRNFVIYLASSIAAGALPLVLMPFLTHALAPGEYGVMVTVTTVVALIGPLVNWATTAYIGVQYFKVPAELFPSTLSSVLILPIVNVAVLLAVFLLARGPMSAWLDIPPAWVAIIPVMSLLLFLPLMAQTILAMRDRAIGFAAIEISGAAINFVMTIAFVLWLGWGWEGRIVAAIVASTTLTAIALIWFVRRGFLRRHFMDDVFRDALRFGAGGVAHDLANNALRLGDRLLIVTLVGQAAVGTYAVAVQWTTIMLTVLTAFNRAWVPFLFRSLADDTPAARQRIVRYTYLVWLGLLAFWLLFTLATPIGYNLLVDQRYHGSIGAAFWLSLGLFFNGIYLTVVNYLFYLKKTHILACVTVCNLILNMSLAYGLIGIYGSVGAALAFAVTAFVVMVLTFGISQRLYPMPWLRGLAR